jgi:hypothetical protein
MIQGPFSEALLLDSNTAMTPDPERSRTLTLQACRSKVQPDRSMRLGGVRFSRTLRCLYQALQSFD